MEYRVSRCCGCNRKTATGLTRVGHLAFCRQCRAGEPTRDLREVIKLVRRQLEMNSTR